MQVSAVSEDLQTRRELREIAYRLWCECGQNVAETARRLTSDEYGFVVSRQTLQAWKSEYDWEGRAARAEAEALSLKEETSPDSLIADLMTQKKRYDTYLNSLPVGKIDTQAIYAYNGLLKTIVDIQKKTADTTVNFDRPAVFLENLGFVAATLKEIDPEGLKVLARNFDMITERFKESLNA